MILYWHVKSTAGKIGFKGKIGNFGNKGVMEIKSQSKKSEEDGEKRQYMKN